MDENEKQTLGEPLDLRSRINSAMEKTKEAKRVEKLAKLKVEREKTKSKTAKKAFKMAKKKAKTAGSKLAVSQKELAELLKKTKAKRVTPKR